MANETLKYALWALTLGAVSAVSLPLGSLVGLNVRFSRRFIAIFAAFGAGALIAALSVELVAPTALALSASEAHEEGGLAFANFMALIVGGIAGGVLFVALDAVVNGNGGYLRKSSTTLAHIAKRDRTEVEKSIGCVLKVRPFEALPSGMATALTSMLEPVSFRNDEVVLESGAEFCEAYIIVDGELDIEVGGKPWGCFGPGSLLGVIALFVPEFSSLGRVVAKGDAKCLVLKREDVNHLRALSPAFDQACRELAGEHLGQVEEHLVTQLTEAVEWTRSAADALRRGSEVPALTLRRTHDEQKGSPLAVWLGILLDGIPESLVIGAGLFVMIAAHPDAASLRFIHVVPYTLIAGLFLSNFPEALSSSANMMTAGWARRRIFFMWFALMVTTSIGAGLGFMLAGELSETWLVFAEGLAAGAMLTMIAAAMIPEAAEHGNPSAVGLSTLAGFLAAVMFKLLE